MGANQMVSLWATTPIIGQRKQIIAREPNQTTSRQITDTSLFDRLTNGTGVLFGGEHEHNKNYKESTARAILGVGEE